MLGAMGQPPLARSLLDRFRWFDDALLSALRERLGLDITSAQSLLFAGLSEEGVRQADLARELGVSRQAVNELVAGLVRQGLVSVAHDPRDRRAKLVRPTPQGRESIALAHEVFRELEATLEQRIGASVVNELRAALAADWGDVPQRPGAR